MFSRLIALAALLALASCSSPGAGDFPAVVRPLAPLPHGENRTFTHHIVAHVGQGEHHVIGASRLGPDLLKVSLLSPEGLSLVDIAYDGREVTAQRQFNMSPRLPPRALVADLQLIYWPLPLLRSSLPSRWELREARVGNTLQRSLFLDGTLYTEVTYSTVDIWNARVSLEQKVLGYRLSIENL